MADGTRGEGHGSGCRCAEGAHGGAEQTLDEVAFGRSLCGLASVGDVDGVAALLSGRGKRQAGVNDLSPSGYSALHYAARNGRMDMVGLLLAAGADVAVATKAGGATALHRAAVQGHAHVVAALLDAGACPAAQDVRGATPVHKAAGCGFGNVAVAMLAAAGDGGAALAGLRDGKGRTAEEYAVECGEDTAAAAIRAFVAEWEPQDGA